MGIPIIGDLIDEIGGIVGKLIPDKTKKLEMQHELDMLRDKFNERAHAEAMAQMEVNAAEAKHASIFVAGWRPAIGWICGAGIGWNFVIAPFAEMIARWVGWKGLMPELDIAMLVALVTTMLGSSGLRTWEKMNGVARRTIAAPEFTPVLELAETPEETTTPTEEEIPSWMK